MRLRLPIVLSLFCLVAACSSNSSKTPNGPTIGLAPEISSVTPANAPLEGGGYAVLHGLGFKTGAVVTVGGANSPAVTVADGQTLTFKMPAGRPGPADLVVQNPDGGKNVFLQAVSYQPATAALPTLTHVSPNSGPAAGGTVVSLVGSGFSDGAVLIVAGAPAATLTVVSPTQASALIPHHAGSGTGDVIFTNPDGQSAVLFGGYAYADSLPAKAPKLTDVAPTEGSVEGGNRVLIKVDNLAPNALLFIGGRPVSYEPAAGGISATMPGARKHGLVDFAVTNADGQSDVLPGAYNYVDGHIAVPPALARVTPPVGPIAGGGRVLIQGDGFQSGAQVLFGGKTATSVIVAGQHALTCIVPPGAAGSADVTLQNADGGLVTLQKGFTYVNSTGAAPAVTAVAPNTGPASGGTVALISGTGFQDGAIVLVAGRPADLTTVVSASTVTARFPAVPAGSADVTVTNPDGQSGTLRNAFAVAAAVSAAAPRVNGVTPQGGPIEGGSAAIVTGDGFAPGARAFVGGKPAAAAVVGPNALAITVPAGDTTGNADVAITNPDGQSDVLPGGYNYFNAPPVITNLSTTCGVATGGTAVVISGRSFRPGVSATIGGQPLTGLIRQDSSTLSGTTGPGHAGAVDVVVTNPDGQADSIGGGFFYTDSTHACQTTGTGQLSLRRVVPNSGALTGGSVITLVGDGFAAGITIKFGDTTATDVRLLGTGALTVTLPSAARVGPADVTVSLPDGRLSRLAGAFNYFDPTSNLPPPTLSAVAPNAGPNTGGSVVQITGTGFAPGARIFFGSAEAGLPTLVDAQHVVAVTPNSLPGPVDVTVMNSDGKSGTLTLGFAFYPAGAAGAPPLAQSVNPRTGSTLSPTTTFVQGSGFQPGALVFFGGVPATSVHAQPDGSLAVVVAPQASGTVDVVVTNPDGQSSTIHQGFTFSAPAPHIAQVLPAFGSPAGGTTVVVTGSGFAAGDVVQFGGTTAAVKLLDDTALFATLPAHDAGIVNVDLVRNGGVVDSKTAGFEYRAGYNPGPPPTVAALEPATGPVSGGTVLWLTGTNLAQGMQVFFGANPAVKVVLSDASHAVVTAPAGAAGFADVNIVNPDGQAGALLRGFAYVADGLLAGLAPRLSALTPDHGPETTDTVDILTGRNFVSGEYVFVGAARGAGVRLLSSSIINTTFPHQAAGIVDVAVTHPDGRSSTLPQSFTFQARPTIVSVAATASNGGGGSNTGTTKGGTAVTIAGTGFQSGATVTIGGRPATQVVVASGSIATAVTPAGAAGAADVVLINPDGQAATSVGGWLYVSPPTATSMWPANGPASGNTIAVVTGTDFDPHAVAYVGNSPCETVVGSSGSLAVTMPAGGGTVDVVVKNPDGQTSTLAGAFTYTSVSHAPPTLSSISPSTGPSTGSSFVSVAGGGFVSGTRVILGGTQLARNLVVSPGTMTGLTPSHAPGAVRVAVTTPDGFSARIDAAYTYVDVSTLGLPPTVNNTLPTSAPAAPGGSPLSIVGANFQTGALVFIQGRPAPTSGGIQQNGTAITVSLPAGTPGPADVAVTNPDGQSSIGTGIFNYTVPPPQLDGVTPLTPTRGPTSGRTPVVIKGSYFVPPVQVIFGQSAATVTFANDHEIDVLTPASVNGAVAVYVINSDRQQSTPLAGAFTYNAPPVITQVSPTSGPLSGGRAVTIQGQFFSGTAQTLSVKFGNQTAPIVGTPTSTVVQVTSPAAPGNGTQAVAVTITNDDAQSFTLPGGYVYLAPQAAPIVSGVTPNSGVLQGNNTVTVLGANFQSGAQVFFGADAATGRPAAGVLVTSDGALNCIVPAGTTAGAVGITVKNPDQQQGTLPGAYTYVNGPPPASLSLTFIAPAQGDTGGGTQVLLGGTGFQTGANVVLVPHDGSSCPPSACTLTNVLVLGPTAITATIPAQPLQAVSNYDVTVQQPGGSQTLANAWAYGHGQRRWTPLGNRTPMESNYGKSARGLSGLYSPAWTGVVGNFTQTSLNTADVWMGGSSGRAPRLYQGTAPEGATAKQRTFTDFTRNQRNPDGSVMVDNCCGSSNHGYNYRPYKPMSFDLDGNGWPDIAYWNDDRHTFTIEWNSNGVLQTTEYGNPYVYYYDPTDFTGGYDYRGQIVDFNLDGFPDFVFSADGSSGRLPAVFLSCGAGTATIACSNSSTWPNIQVAITPGQRTITTAQLSSWYYTTDLRSFMVAGQTKLMIDNGASYEVVTVSDVTATSFTANFFKAHAVGVGVGMVFDVTSSTAVAANTDTYVHLSSMQGMGLTPYLVLVADPNTPNEERVQINASPDFAGGTVRFHFYKAHAAGFRMTSKDPHWFVPDTSRFPGTATDASYAVVAGDIDGNGSVDVITGNNQQGIKVWLNNAKTLKNAGSDPNAFVFTLATSTTIPTGVTSGNVRALSLFDANGDTLPDLLVGYDGNSQERLFINQGSGIFADETNAARGTGCKGGGTGARLPLPLNDSIVRYDVRDFNGDGSLDVLAWVQVNGTQNSFQKPLRLWLNDGQGCFTGGSNVPGQPTLTDALFPPALGVQQTWNYALGDFNGDGYPDMLAAFDSVQTREYINTGAPQFLDKTLSNFPAAQLPGDSQRWWRWTMGSMLVDLNGDGFPDLVTTEVNYDPQYYFYTPNGSQQWCGYPQRQCYLQPDGSGVHVYLNDTKGNFPHDDTLTVFPSVVDSAQKVVSALPIASWGMDNVDHLWNGAGGSGPQALLVTSATDYNYQGIPTILKGGNFDSTVGSARLLVNNGNGTFSDVTYPRLPQGRFSYSASVKFVDLDGDGNPDIVMGDAGNGQIQVWQNTGNGYFTDVTASAVQPGGGLTNSGCNGSNNRVNQIVAANFDQDNLNRPDLLVVRDCNMRLLINKSANGVIKLVDESTCDGSFCTTPRLPTPPPGAVSAVVANLDCVGGQDLFLIQSDGAGTPKVLLNSVNCSNGSPCGFFTDASNTYLQSVGACVGTDCSGNRKAVGLSYDSSNTDIFIARYSDDNTVRPHRLLKNRCGPLADYSQAAWTPIQSDNDKITDVLVGSLFTSTKDPNAVPQPDLMLFGFYAQRVYQNTP